jgi:hypothetical protein
MHAHRINGAHLAAQLARKKWSEVPASSFDRAGLAAATKFRYDIFVA